MEWRVTGRFDPWLKERKIFTQNVFLFTRKLYLKWSKFLCNFTTAWAEFVSKRLVSQRPVTEWRVLIKVESLRHQWLVSADKYCKGLDRAQTRDICEAVKGSASKLRLWILTCFSFSILVSHSCILEWYLKCSSINLSTLMWSFSTNFCTSRVLKLPDKFLKSHMIMEHTCSVGEKQNKRWSLPIKYL